jgi:hypothetical protein
MMPGSSFQFAGNPSIVLGEFVSMLNGRARRSIVATSQRPEPTQLEPKTR